MRKDDEISGSGNSYDFGGRMYSNRLGKWWSVDPMSSKYPELAPYVSFANNPIVFIDPDGEDIKFFTVRCTNCDQSNVVEGRQPEGDEVPAQYERVDASFVQLSSISQGAMKNFIKTKQGLNYIKKYMKAGDTFGSYTAPEDGALSDQILLLGEWSSIASTAAGTSNGNLTFMKNWEINVPENWFTGEFSFNLSQELVMRAPENTQAMVDNLQSDNTQIMSIITLYPSAVNHMSNKDGSLRLGYTMGHESFVHLMRSWSQFSIYYSTGEYDKAFSILEKNAANLDGGIDHTNFGSKADIPSIKMMQSFQKEYEKVAGSKKMKEYKQEDKEKYGG